MDQPSSKGHYAVPRVITDLHECYFYHTMEIPGYGLVEGPWDLRGGEHDYLGQVDFSGKRVLEIGTASGFLCFYMESQGAHVTAYDLSDEEVWDVVPFKQYNSSQFVRKFQQHVRKLNNGYWLSHRAHGSQAKVVYGNVYEVADHLEPADVCTICSVLLHVRDPFLALQKALDVTNETIVITDIYPSYLRLFSFISKVIRPTAVFLPKFSKVSPKEAWWHLPPELIQQFIGILGFEDSKISYHWQRYNGCWRRLYTVVGRRTKPR